MTRILLIRHGQTEWNRQQVFRGRAEIPLSEIGVRQAEALAQRLSSEHISALYCSPLGRASLTAQLIGAPHQISPHPVEDLTDFDYGEWSGKSRPEVAQRWPDLLRQWETEPHLVQMPGGEMLEEARQRAVGAVRGLLSRHSGSTVAAISHRVITKLLLCDFLGLGNEAFWRLWQDTCCLNIIDAEGARVVIRAINDTGHLCGLETDATDF